jgi:hypothetical protein
MVLEPIATPAPPPGWRRRARVHWFRRVSGELQLGWLAPRSH